MPDRQKTIYVDAWTTPRRVVLPLGEAPSEIWVHRTAQGADQPPRGWEMTCEACEETREPAARFCAKCGSACARRETGGLVPFDREWGYWLDQGHDWNWRNGSVHINNAGTDTPGFWLVLNFSESQQVEG